MEIVVTFDIADQSFRTWSIERWNGHIHDLKGKFNREDQEEDAWDMSDEEIIEWQYGDELFFQKFSLPLRFGEPHLCLCHP